MTNHELDMAYMVCIDDNQNPCDQMLDSVYVWLIMEVEA